MTLTADTLLCLACSSSLPPKSPQPLFTTRCCSRPICPACITANPRLARYDPCLACLGGVGVVGSRKANVALQVLAATTRNVDGAVRDEDTYVVGDDEEELEDGDETELTSQESVHATRAEPAHVVPGGSVHMAAAEPLSPPAETTPGLPPKYYIKRGDTLHGISLRFGLDSRELCRLNNLPPSTISTTPHLLHTRGFLTLPAAAQSKLASADTRPSSAEEQAREVRRTRERAEKRLQTLTKEVDWRVAKAYIALAEDPDEADAFALKQKELGAPLGAGVARLEAMAVDRYLDDLEWESEQLRAGRSLHIPSFPLKEQASTKT
ncbi:hypothetical protein B0H15DRAFT_960193 [Mycena belliarum]|uniref:LysM domain-containing protein n=1 Tax=Mycena belliarum TaxID=1033014 RepID=A0AAD6UJI3_9AGAR|nr:hypothetical protein B0H15DRAFT_960193 [Mycena belliae]